MKKELRETVLNLYKSNNQDNWNLADGILDHQRIGTADIHFLREHNAFIMRAVYYPRPIRNLLLNSRWKSLILTGNTMKDIRKKSSTIKRGRYHFLKKQEQLEKENEKGVT